MIQRKSINTLEFKDLSFAFEGARPLFENISMAMPTSRVVWVRSPGGRGKSTLLKILAGLIVPQSGSYLMNGINVGEMSFEDFLPYRLNIGYGFDMGGLLNNKSLAENLILPLIYHSLLSAEEAFDRVHGVTDLFGMQDIRDLRPFGVSGSYRKLTCVMRAFIHQPEVVILDDPMTGLKQDNLNDLYHFVEENFAAGTLRQVFFTSENPEFAQRFKADELLISPDWFTSRPAA